VDSSLHLAGFLSALALSAALVRLCIPLALRLRLVDRPGHRKIHRRPVPYLGGAGLFAALALAFGVSQLFFDRPGSAHSPSLAVLLTALAGAALGLADDIHNLTPRMKFLVQAGLALAFSWLAFRFEVLHLPGFQPLDLGWLCVPFTAFFIIAVANGMNMVDGSDGLCASSAVMSLLLAGLAAWTTDQPQLSLLALSACGAGLGFLVWNRAPARIYLGDAGSQGLGFLLACTLVALGQDLHPPAFFAGGRGAQPFHYQVILAVLLAGFPALEVTLSVLRRGLQGRHLFRGDQGHLHHRLARAGLSSLGVARSAAAYSLLSGGVALAILLREKGIAVLLAMGLVGLLGLVLSHLGYARFLQRRWLDERRPHFAVAIHFHALQCARLQLAAGVDEVQALVVQACREFGAVRCVLSLPARGGAKAWTWSWQLAGASETPGALERVRLRGVGSAAWLLGPLAAEPELEMEVRVLMSEFMAKALERAQELGPEAGR
jgi:UDP-GlcNAc:undecaprenyl-phosphate GlcNAc-1-phosphate transferase